MGCKTTPSRGRRYRAQNRKLRKLGWNNRHGIVVAPRLYLYQKTLPVWKDQKCISLVGGISPLTCADRQTTPSRGIRTGPITESCLKWVGPIATVPCLHQGNIYTKRKLRVWREQKCIPLVGVKTIVTCADRQTTPSRGRWHWVKTGKLSTMGGTYCHGSVFAPRQYLYQNKTMGIHRSEMYSTSRWNNPTYLCGPSNYPVSRDAVQGLERKVA